MSVGLSAGPSQPSIHTRGTSTIYERARSHPGCSSASQPQSASPCLILITNTQRPRLSITNLTQTSRVKAGVYATINNTLSSLPRVQEVRQRNAEDLITKSCQSNFFLFVCEKRGLFLFIPASKSLLRGATCWRGATLIVVYTEDIKRLCLLRDTGVAASSAKR